jgi:hypothetical protein
MSVGASRTSLVAKKKAAQLFNHAAFLGSIRAT